MLMFQKMSTFQATQLLSCAYRSAYVPSSYAIISKGTLSIPCQVTLTFQDTQLRLCFKIRRHKDAFESLKISFPQDYKTFTVNNTTCRCRAHQLSVWQKILYKISLLSKILVGHKPQVYNISNLIKNWLVTSFC